ncbi:hypothetical protein BDQ17DRAFT_865628 [Cyathus striatus]|nr:hypothetical protein BDQ17DRAFT_865628 [Cyathus striatus]
MAVLLNGVCIKAFYDDQLSRNFISSSAAAGYGLSLDLNVCEVVHSESVNGIWLGRSWYNGCRSSLSPANYLVAPYYPHNCPIEFLDSRPVIRIPPLTLHTLPSIDYHTTSTVSLTVRSPLEPVLERHLTSYIYSALPVLSCYLYYLFILIRAKVVLFCLPEKCYFIIYFLAIVLVRNLHLCACWSGITFNVLMSFVMFFYNVYLAHPFRVVV